MTREIDYWGIETNKIGFEPDSMEFFNSRLEGSSDRTSTAAINQAITETLLYRIARDEGWSIFEFLRSLSELTGRITHPHDGPQK